ncbi:MAG TPA: biopolymer transporter ExbD [Candidatus Tidjanibacter faecipullorum]|uniref:Biopolymer transporter ExbD n=1 Tax=Candidatus Tidjanibacter faecipullorum TaxID=2838766 RepID=A0A9D2DDQ4_9BACT|nr:biopolymer transporter ExbD [Candidatus Tidjanibacter faecipullorum]
MAINKRKIPEINAGSMADIAFLLLIFFLVATTMNTDTGIQRVLPPWVENPTDDAPPIKERNLMAVKVNQYDQIQMQGKLVDLHQVKDLAKEFILNAGNSEDLPEKKMTEIELIGQYPVSEGVISLQNDRGTSYDMYIKVQNELTRAFNEIRDNVARQYFGAPVSELDDAKREAIQKAVPNKISEAEPKNIGGN